MKKSNEAFGLFDYSMFPKLNRILKPYGGATQETNQPQLGRPSGDHRRKAFCHEAEAS